MIGAVDIGGTKIAVGMVDDAGRVLAKTESPTRGERGYADGLARIESMLRETAQAAGGKRRLIYVTVGTGIGGGIVLDGQLYRGVDRAHPEVGHHVIDASGPACTCGFRGCWEALATGPAMAAWYKGKAGSRADANGLGAREIFELARAGDSLAREAVERETHYLALGLANLIGLFVPEVIVLGGSVMKSVRLEDLREVIAQGCRFVPWEKTELALASLGEDANLIGAARVWHARFAGDGEPG